MGTEKKDSGPEFMLAARNDTIANLIEQCARGDLPFSGPDSLYQKVTAMGYSGNSLYEMVIAAESAMLRARESQS